MILLLKNTFQNITEKLNIIFNSLNHELLFAFSMNNPVCIKSCEDVFISYKMIRKFRDKHLEWLFHSSFQQSHETVRKENWVKKKRQSLLQSFSERSWCDYSINPLISLSLGRLAHFISFHWDTLFFLTKSSSSSSSSSSVSLAFLCPFGNFFLINLVSFLIFFTCLQITFSGYLILNIYFFRSFIFRNKFTEILYKILQKKNNKW